MASLAQRHSRKSAPRRTQEQQRIVRCCRSYLASRRIQQRQRQSGVKLRRSWRSRSGELRSLVLTRPGADDARIKVDVSPHLFQNQSSSEGVGKCPYSVERVSALNKIAHRASCFARCRGVFSSSSRNSSPLSSCEHFFARDKCSACPLRFEIGEVPDNSNRPHTVTARGPPREVEEVRRMKVERPKSPTKFYTIEQIAEWIEVSRSTRPATKLCASERGAVPSPAIC